MFFRSGAILFLPEAPTICQCIAGITSNIAYYESNELLYCLPSFYMTTSYIHPWVKVFQEKFLSYYEAKCSWRLTGSSGIQHPGSLLETQTWLRFEISRLCINLAFRGVLYHKVQMANGLENLPIFDIFDEE